MSMTADDNNSAIIIECSTPLPECEDQSESNACLLVLFLWILIILLILGLIKAILGLCIAPIGIWGLDQITSHPHEIDQYREKHLKNRMVVYDDTGWPVHPDTCKRSVRALSCPAEFLANIFFFIIYPLVLLLKLLGYILCCQCLSIIRNQDSCECFEWINTIACSEVRTDVEKKNLLPSDSKHKNSVASTVSKHGRKIKKSDADSSVTRISISKSTYDDNTDQEKEDTKYVLEALHKSKASLKTEK